MHKLQNITLENNLSDLVIAGERQPWTMKILFSISADKLKITNMSALVDYDFNSKKHIAAS